MEKLIDELAKGRKMERFYVNKRIRKLGLEFIDKNSKIVRN